LLPLRGITKHQRRITAMPHPKLHHRRSAHVTTIATMLTAVCVTVLLSFAHSPVHAQTPAAAGEVLDLVGKTAPGFDLAQTAGNFLKSSDLKGKVVVVDLWAAWCPPCVDEIPSFNALSEKYKDKDVRIVGIAIDSGTLDDVKAKVKELHIEYPLLFGTEKTMSDFGIHAFPATLVLTKDWKVHHAYLNSTPNKRELIEQEIDALLSEQ
jgi:thiol-disulfide isomerase/thioredoxin